MKRICVILMIITSLSFACGKDEVKPSADSVTAQEALRVSDAIRTAYEEKEGTVLRDNMSPELAEGITENLSFEKAELSFTPRLVKITDSTVAVNINWHGTWVVKNKTIKNLGSGILIFQSRSMKLIRIEGDNPFLAPLVKE